MVKKKIKTQLLLLITASVVGIFIASNFNFSGKASSQINAKEYQLLQEEKNNLLSEVNGIMSDNNKIESKIEDYEGGGNKNQKIVSGMKNDLQIYGRLSGLYESKGKGVVVTIKDATIYHGDDSSYEMKRKIFHDEDAENVINAIRLAGAEAISLNNHRITPVTGIKCYWAFLRFEDGTEEYPTFNFYAIGDPEVLKENLLAEGSYLNTLSNRGLGVTIEQKEEIILKAGTIYPITYAEDN